MTEAIRAIRVDNLGLLSEGEMAILIDVKPHTLAVWRAEGKGPDFTRLGKSVFYRLADVERWVDANVVSIKQTA